MIKWELLSNEWAVIAILNEESEKSVSPKPGLSLRWSVLVAVSGTKLKVALDMCNLV